MPDISKEQLAPILSTAPDDNARRDIMQELSNRGYTVAGQRIRIPGAPPPMLPSGASLIPAPLERGANAVLGGINRFTQETLPQATANLVAGRMGMPNAARLAMGVEQAAGQMIPANLSQAGQMVVIGQALSEAGPALREGAGAISRGLGRAAAGVSGKLSGLTGQGTEEIAGTPGIAKKALKSMFAKVQTIFNTVGQQRLERGVDSALDDIGSQIGKFEDEYVGTYRPPAGANLSTEATERKVQMLESPRISTEGIREKLRERLISTGSDMSGQNPDLGISPGQNAWLQEKMKQLRNGRMNFEELLGLKREIGEKIKTWGKMAGQGKEGQYNGILRSFYGDVNSVLTESIPESDVARNPFTGKLEPARKVWRAVNDRYSEALDARAEIYRHAVGTTPETTETRINQSLRSRNWQNNRDRARVLGPKAEQALEEAKNIMLTKNASSLAPEHGHGAYAWYLGTLGSLGALVGGKATGNRAMQMSGEAGLGLLGATSPLFTALVARTAGLAPEVVSHIANFVSTNPAAKAIVARAVAQYSDEQSKKKNRPQTP